MSSPIFTASCLVATNAASSKNVGDTFIISATLKSESMNGKFLAIDFETANPKRDSACSIGLVRVEHGKIVHQAAHLIRPPYRDFMFTHIHGISWRDVASEPTFKEVWDEISPLFEGIDFLAAHNASFDSSVLKACCATYRLSAPTLPFTCTVKVARSLWDLRPTKLPDVAKHLKIQLKHHEALSDALACAQIMIAAQRETAQLKKATPPEKAILSPIGKILIRRRSEAAML
jgi:DNA polymerase III subunit epsilon